MSQGDRHEPGAQDWEDSTDIGLTDEDRDFLSAVDNAYSHRTFKYLSLDAAAEQLLERLKAARGREEIEVFGLESTDLDAAGILTQSGEAFLYRNKRGRLCIAHSGNALIEGLLLHG